MDRVWMKRPPNSAADGATWLSKKKQFLQAFLVALFCSICSILLWFALFCSICSAAEPEPPAGATCPEWGHSPRRPRPPLPCPSRLFICPKEKGRCLPCPEPSHPQREPGRYGWVPQGLEGPCANCSLSDYFSVALQGGLET